MMGNYAIYDKDTGVIRQTITGNYPQVLEDLLDNEELVEIADNMRFVGATHYVDIITKELKEKEYKYMSLTEVLSKVVLGDAELDAAINYYLKDKDSVTEWKAEHYDILRAKAYPVFNEYLDAQVKLTSVNLDTIKAGQKQMDKYLTDSLAVKERFPKPVV